MVEPLLDLAEIETAIRSGVWRAWRFGFLAGLPWGALLGRLLMALVHHLT